MVRLAAASAVLAALLTAGPGHAAEPSATPAFSTARDDVSVMLWLRRNTSLRLGQSVVFSPDNVLVIESDTVATDQPSIHRVGFRQEATRVDFVARTGGRSIRGAAEVDCRTGKVKASSIALYYGSDLRGDQITSQGPDLEWRAPFAGTASALVMSEVCTTRAPPNVAVSAPPPAPRPVAAAAPPSPATPSLPPAPARPPTPAAAPAPARPGPPAPAAAPPAAADDSAVVAQIGAFSTRALAEGAWAQLMETYPAYVEGKTHRIEPVIVGGVQLFRTSIQGFESEAAARSTCADLMARSQACFVRKAP
ncbi:MAG TPA: SPOR domain-containing protein [Caulobacteraceae bacterium]|jgi:cell division septation protein DedD|nr:SPOR domain-containing protein [Caulobacteraceae bacterium]